jgi:hypothetical protein
MGRGVLVGEEEEGGDPVILLDTQAFLEMFKTYGFDFFEKLPQKTYITTYGVLNELENQQLSDRRGDDGKLICPGRLMGMIYELISQDRISVTEVEITEEQRAKAKELLIKGSGEQKNSRVGQGDLELLVAAEQRAPEKTVILTEDSDIHNIVLAGGYNNITAMNVTDYMRFKPT